MGTYRLYSARFMLLNVLSGGRRWPNLACSMHTHDHWVLDHEGHFVVMSFNVIGRIMHVPTYEMRSSCKEFDARHIEVVYRCYATRKRCSLIAPIMLTHGQVLLSDDEHLILE